MTYPVPRTKSTKALVAAVGTTLTALSTALATISLVVGDDAIDVTEIGSVASAVAAAGGTIYGVWRAYNRPVSAPGRLSRP